MLRSSESETEILLGNKQLLGIFFVVALLLAVAFYGGYMVGQGAGSKRAPASSGAPVETASANTSGGGGETHVVPAGDSNAASDEAPLGAPKHKTPARKESPEQEAAGAGASEPFAPQVGQQFLQVAAVSRDEAEALADVLHKKGFRAHAVPKPGSSKVYRVIIGPLRDAADLSSTRDALMRNAGFREVIPQRY